MKDSTYYALADLIGIGIILFFGWAIGMYTAWLIGWFR